MEEEKEAGAIENVLIIAKLTEQTRNMSLKIQEEDAFSSIDCVGQCLIDEVRTKAFEKAIKRVTKPDWTALDIGTGSGIMALFAARSGAKNVFAVEYDPCVADIARENFVNNGFGDKINLIIGDARDLKFKNNIKFDLVIMEMLTTGMIDEFQVQAVNNLHKQKVVFDSTVFIPCVQETYISLAEMNFSMYDFEMKMVKHLWHGLSENQNYSIKSESKLLNSVSFGSAINEKFNGIITLKIDKSGVVNCVHISSKTYLTDKIVIGDTETLNAPVVVPIAERHVKKGDELNVHVSYIFGKGFQNFKAEIIGK
ncbi:methyltransferase domain-containing protein [Patescibacteria group bacterium]|nr:MAG: methyltransferase domain-containing protein [Patescibacteria group bacterium]